MTNGIADSLHGRHLLVDAVGALYNTCRRALASPEDSIERATARSALARRARGWGCSVAPTSWLGSAEHLATAVEMEKAMEAKGAKPEALDFFILYTAWMTVQDREIRHERMRAGNISPPERPVVAMEHGDDPYGEAIASPNHSAWANGTSSTLFDVLRRSAPISLLSAGIIRIEHMCRPADADHDFEFVPFSELAKAWSLPTSQKVVADWRSLVQDLSKVYDGVSTWWPQGDYRYSTRRPLSSRELWDGTQRILTDGALSTGWPRGDTRQSRWGGRSVLREAVHRESYRHAV